MHFMEEILIFNVSEMEYADAYCFELITLGPVKPSLLKSGGSNANLYLESSLVSFYSNRKC